MKNDFLQQAVENYLKKTDQLVHDFNEDTNRHYQKMIDTFNESGKSNEWINKIEAEGNERLIQLKQDLAAAAKELTQQMQQKSKEEDTKALAELEKEFS